MLKVYALECKHFRKKNNVETNNSYINMNLKSIYPKDNKIEII